MGKSKSKKPKVDYEQAWRTYSSWQADDAREYARERTAEVARMAASGMKAGSLGYEERLAGIDKRYEEKSRQLAEGATGSTLRKRYEKKTRGLTERPTMEEFYEGLYGKGAGSAPVSGDSATTPRPTGSGVRPGTGSGMAMPQPAGRFFAEDDDDQVNWSGV